MSDETAVVGAQTPTAPTDAVALHLRGFSAFYGPVAAFRDLELEVQAGGITGLVGPNGAGKSTLLKAIAGLVRSTGHIQLAGHDISRLRTPGRFRSGLGYVPQEHVVVGRLTLLENLKLSWLAGRRQMTFDQRVTSVTTLFPALADRLEEPASNLSGGQRQMLAISRGLATDPEVLLLDEPTAGLAPALIAELATALGDLAQESGITMLLVEQNVRVARKLCRTINVMVDGRLVWAGAGDELERDTASRLYLGTG